MANKKVFTDESLGTFVDEIKSYVDEAVATKANTSHSHKVANISDLTATAKELNYMDGVTSNVQTQLDTLTNTVNGKANSSHTHNYAGSSSAGGDANNALKLQGYTRSNLYKDLHDWINAVGLTHTIVVEGDKDTYYPVRIHLPSAKTMPTYVSIHKNLGTQTPEIEGNHSNGTSSMWLIYEGRNRSWDGNGGYLKTWYRYMGYANLCAHADIGSSAVGDLIVWLRGGGCLYQVSKTANTAEPSIYYEETNIGTEDYPYMVAPRTDLGNKGAYSGTLGYGNIEGNATTATRATQDSNGNVIVSTYETKTNATNKLAEAKTYADSAANKVKNDLLNNAGGAYDTLKELGDLIDDNTDAIEALETVASNKANASDLTSHTSNKSNPHGVTMAQLGISSAGSSLGLVKTGGDVTISSGVITVNDDSHNHTIANVDNLQTSLDAKQNTITGGATTITGSNLTANRALISNGSGKVAVSAVTSTELGYLDGVTSNVQTQLDGKAASSHTHSISNVSGLQSALDGKSSTSHTHNYAGSASIGGGANTLAITDTRNVNDTPTEMTNLIGGKGARLDFKSTNTVGLSNGTYAAVLSISPWGDTTNWSGGKNTQLGFCDDGRIQVRKGNGSGWTDWNTLIDSSTIGNQSVKYATSAGSATSATKATQDASGNVITSTYATKTELDTAKSTLQTSINGKANSSHTHTIANITNLQTTLDGKAASSHNHAASNITSGTLSSDRLPTVPIAKGGTGATTAAAALTNLGITATATELNKLDGVTATTAELNYVDGVTSNIQTQLNGKAASTHTHNKDTINSVYDTRVTWGGEALSGSVSPMGASLSSEHSANRIAYLNSAAITVEYSNDAGSTWTDSGLASSAKTNLVTTSNTVSVGSNSTVTTSHRTRITLTAQNGTTGYVYTRPRKMLINVSTPHGLTVTIEAKTGVSGASWTTLGTYTLSGWSGWNDIPMNISTFGGSTTQTGNYWYLRLTFANTSVNSSYTTTKSSIIGLRLFGDTCWTRTSNMGETGHLYSYDYAQNATFPASISGTGTLSMNRKSGTSVGSYSIALGQDCESSGAGSFAEGGFTVASGRYSHAEGYQSKATATYAHAEGVSTNASAMYSHAEGNTTTASGLGCHAEGCETTASGINTHAEGLGTQATSNGDHAEGGYTVASGVFSHAEGYYTKAASSYQHVQGQYNIVDSNNTYLHIVGNGESDTARSNAHTLDRSGNAWYSGDVYVGGTAQSSGTKLVSLTTTKATITSFSSGWALYGSNTTPTVRKFGNTVSLTGAIKNTSAVTLNTSHVQVFTIPSGYRPVQDLVVVCQGSGANRYVLQIATSGAVSIGRYGTTSFAEVSSGSWFPFHVTWVIE